MRSWTYCVLLVVCLARTGQTFLDAPPKILVNAITSLSGSFSNKEQIDAGSTEHDYVQARFFPVTFPFQGYPLAVVVEIVVNGRVSFINLLLPRLSEIRRDVVKFQACNITDISKLRPGQFTAVDAQKINVNTVKCSPTCSITFTALAGRILLGMWKDCRTTIGGQHPAYTILLACDAFASTVPLFVPEKAASTPYEFKLLERFPLPPGFPDVFNLCLI